MGVIGWEQTLSADNVHPWVDVIGSHVTIPPIMCKRKHLMGYEAVYYQLKRLIQYTHRWPSSPSLTFFFLLVPFFRVFFKFLATWANGLLSSSSSSLSSCLIDACVLLNGLGATWTAGLAATTVLDSCDVETVFEGVIIGVQEIPWPIDASLINVIGTLDILNVPCDKSLATTVDARPLDELERPKLDATWSCWLFCNMFWSGIDAATGTCWPIAGFSCVFGELGVLSLTPSWTGWEGVSFARVVIPNGSWILVETGVPAACAGTDAGLDNIDLSALIKNILTELEAAPLVCTVSVMVVAAEVFFWGIT